MTNSLNTVKNLLWKFGERCGAQLISFIVSLILARIIEPALYGQLAIVLAFITIMQVFIDNGLSTCLIQKKDSDDIDFSSVFYFNLLLSVLLYLIIFISAPFISNFYDIPLLSLYIRVMSFNIIISSVKSVQQAYVSKNLIFKKFFFSTILGTIIAAIVSIYMAYHEFGIWALIVNYMLNNTIDTIILWFTVKWRPKKYFSISRLKTLLPFGFTVFLTYLTNSLYGEFRQLIIGKKYSNSDLAYYNRARQFPFLFVENINAAIDGVLFPTMSNVSDDRKEIKEITRSTIKISTYIFAPLLFGLIAISKPLIILLLTEKWSPCIPYIPLFCIIFLFQPLHMANKIAIKSMGKGNVLFKQEIINDVIGVLILLFVFKYGVYAIAVGYLISSFSDLIINCFPNRKLIKYGLINQLIDIAPTLLLGLLMCIIVYLIPTIGFSYLLTIIVKIIVGGVFYIGMSMIFHVQVFYDSINIVKKLLKTQ